MSTGTDTDARNLDWLVANFVERVPGVLEAVAVSADGLIVAMSSGLSRADADRFAAVAAGMISLAEGAAGMNGGAVREVVVEMERALLLVTRISPAACLAVSAERSCDVGLVGYEMALLGRRVGPHLTPALITELRARLRTT